MFKQLSAAMWARVQVMWLLLAITAAALGIFAVGMGNFVQDNVRDELAYQQIALGPFEEMSEHEQAIPGIEEFAGGPITNGEGARVYSEYILLHMTESAEEAGYPGATYATLGGPQRELRAQVAELEESGDTAALEEAQAELDEVTGLRNSMLNGSNLRGQLLNSYGWDTVGTNVSYAGYGLIGLAVVFALLFVFERIRGHLPASTTSRQH